MFFKTKEGLNQAVRRLKRRWCVVCGKSIPFTSFGVKFCSKECKRKHTREYQQNRRKLAKYGLK